MLTRSLRQCLKTIQSSEKPYVPLHEIRVEQGKSYRLRIISHGFMNCPIEMSIESHSMIVIGGDGRDLNQTEVSSLGELIRVES